jgi:prepilin-type N-terminal cleavage/methylation domain-containing protein
MIKARGFTLIELLVVIAIIGILAGILITSLMRARTAALDSKHLQELRQVKTALELYNTSNNRYPAPGVSLPANLQSFNSECWNGDCYFSVSGTSIKDTTRLQSALSNFWGGNPDNQLYIYKVDPAGKNYKLFTFLETTSAIPGSFLDTAFFAAQVGDSGITFNVPGPMGFYVDSNTTHGVSIASSDAAKTWNIYCTFDGSTGNTCAQ